jgi:hypothetical protein
MEAKGSAMTRSVVVSTLTPQAPSPPYRCVTSPTQALPSPSQLAVAEAEMEFVTRVAEAAAAAVVAARGAAAAGVVVVVKN